MQQLLRFEYYRILKSKFIWVIAGLCVLLPVLAAVALQVIYINFGEEDEIIELLSGKNHVRCFTWYVIAYFYERIPLMLALFIPLFIGRDYRDGVIRNKLTAGHTRLEIFSSVVIPQVTVTAGLSIIYVLSGIAAMACTRIGADVNGGEMFIRAVPLLLSLIATAILFCAISLLIKSRAGTVVLCIAFVFSFGMFSLLAYNFSYSRKTVRSYVEVYNEALESSGYDFPDDMKIEEDDYFNAGWYIGRPLFLATNAGLGKEFVSDFTSMISLDEDDSFSYPKKLVRMGYMENMSLSLLMGNYGSYLIDLDDVEGAYVKFQDAELEYNIKSILWGAAYFAGGYALFRKKNIF